MYDHITHIWLFLAAILFTEALAVYAWRFRSIPGARPYAVHKAAISMLLLSLVMASIGNSLEVKAFWIRLYQAGTFIAMIAWMGVTLRMTGRGKWVNRRTVTAILIAAVMAFLLLFSPERYGLYWRTIGLEGENVRVVLGFWGRLILYGGYLILLVCTGLFFRRAVGLKGILRTQAGLIVVSTWITFTGHFLWRFATSPDLRQDLLAAAFIISGCLDAFALFRLRMFDIMSVAQAVVIKSIGDGLAVVDNQGLVVELNPAAERMLGQAGSEVKGQFAKGLFESWPELIRLIDNEEKRIREIRINHQYYTVFSIPLSGQGQRNIGKVLFFHNITPEKTTWDLLNEQQQAAAVIKERNRLGRELHDGQGQLLGFFNMQLAAARSLIAKGQPEKADPLLEQIAQLTQGLYTGLRESITGLKNDTADEGFLRKVDAYLHWFGLNYGIQTHLAVNGELRESALSPIAVVQLQRIIQEALTNVRKHAEAEQVQVTIHAGQNETVIVIEDNGAGFDLTRSLDKSGCYGLRIMQERAAEIGAELNYESRPGKGSTVRITVPVKDFSCVPAL